MKLFKFLAPVTLAAALALTACAPAAPHAADVPYPTYTPATVSTPAAPAPVKVAAVKAPAPKKIAKVVTPAPAPMDTITAPPVRCEEDMPCWNCHTMGNLQCGPAAVPVIPAAYVPCSAVGMVADAHGVCHKPVKAPAAPVKAPAAPVKAPAVAPVDCTNFNLRPYPVGCLPVEGRAIFDSVRRVGTFEETYLNPVTDAVANGFRDSDHVVIESALRHGYAHVFFAANFKPVITAAAFATIAHTCTAGTDPRHPEERVACLANLASMYHVTG